MKNDIEDRAKLIGYDPVVAYKHYVKNPDFEYYKNRYDFDNS